VSAARSSRPARIVRRALGTAAVARALPRERRFPYLPRERILEARDRRVRATLAAAAEHVPHYRDLFRSERIDPREIRTADDLARLPFLDREDVVAAPERFRSERYAGARLTLLHSSGRSGKRVTVARDEAGLLAGLAFSERQRMVEAHLCGRRYRYSVMAIRLPDAAVGRIQRVYGSASFRPLRPRTHVVPLGSPLEHLVERFRSLRPDVVRAYGSYLEALFRTLAAEDVAIPPPRVVSYGGDGMSAAGRAFIEERFGVPVVSVYSAVEAPRIGFTCEARSGFHLNEDLVHVRLVDDADADVAPGEPGQVVVSTLAEPATVLLNYRLGDQARFVDGPCPCGRTLRRLDDLDGRVGRVFRLEDGTLVHQYSIWYAMFAVEGLVNFQAVQRGEGRFDLLLQTAPSDWDRVARRATEVLAGLLPGWSFTPVPAERLGVEGRTGKFERFVLLDGERRP
jgi:phenylacetate-CoA ligase